MRMFEFTINFIYTGLQRYADGSTDNEFGHRITGDASWFLKRGPLTFFSSTVFSAGVRPAQYLVKFLSAACLRPMKHYSPLQLY